MVSQKSKGKTFKDKNNSSTYGVEDISSDARFAHIASDPKYRNISSRNLKIKVDERFKSALKNEKFTIEPALDPRGKPKNYGTKEGLHKFYDLESSSESDTDDEEEEEISEADDEDNTVRKQKEKAKDEKRTHKEQKNQRKVNEDRKEEFLASLLNPERDLARGDTFYSDDSSDDDSSTTDEDEEEEELKEFEWGELDGDAQWDVDGREVEETSRFAVCDMDWDNVKAVDLFVLFSSFAPSGGIVKKVTIYPSSFGKERMAEEELKGPQELIRLAASHKKRHDDELSYLEKLKKGTLEESNMATSLELEALRRYQRNRLKYYYGVVECDTVETAKIIYKECDRTHYEVIGVNLDLRYIPSGMEFDEVPHDVCEKIPNAYESENFQIASLAQVKPTLTWDDTDRRRQKVLKNAMTKSMKKENFNTDLLNDFVAGSESEQEDDVKESCSDDEDANPGKDMKGERIAKFRALISEINEKETKKRDLTFDMEDTFAAVEEDKSDSENNNNEESVNDMKEHNNIPQEQDSENDNLTPFEKILLKKKQKRKDRKLKLKKMRENTNAESENESGFEDSRNSPDEDLKTNKKGKWKKGKSKRDTNNIVPESTENDLALLVMDEEEEEKKHFDMRKIKEQKEKMEKKNRKRKNKGEHEEEEKEKLDDFKVDASDPRFAALFSHGSFNVDPSHPQYDKHSSLSHGITQKQKKMKTNPKNKQQQIDSKSKLDSDISNMIRSFRLKTSKLK